jgi:hypothetical protein
MPRKKKPIKITTKPLILLPKSYQPAPTIVTPEEARLQKIVVALFLILGKTIKQLPFGAIKNCEVSESEIAQAWKTKKSPVRIISEVSSNGMAGSFGGDEKRWCAINERTFRVVAGDLDLNKVAPNFATVKVPKEIGDPAKGPDGKPKSRVFDLE